MTFSEKLLRLRKARNMSQEELAERLEVSRQAVSRWEMGTAMPDAVNILAISKLFGVTTDYLLYDEMERFEVPIAASAPQEQGKGRKFFKLQYLLTGMLLIQAVLSFMSIWKIAKDWLILSIVNFSLLETLRMGGAQMLLVISFELFFSKRNMPDIDHGLYRALFYRVSIWNIAFVAICGVVYPLLELLVSLFFYMLNRIAAVEAWNVPLPWSWILPIIWKLLLYAAVCLPIFFLCQRTIKRRRT